jgi:hypothetical protein
MQPNALFAAVTALMLAPAEGGRVWPADRLIEPPSWLGLALLLALAAASSGVALTYPEAIAAAFG